MLLEVSVGEALDKLTILEIKKAYIDDDYKLKHVLVEIEAINSVIPYKEKYSLLYKLLYYTNKKIWDLQDDIVSNMLEDAKLIQSYNLVFKLNQQRFRIKNLINKSEGSIKEQKSYRSKTLYLIFESEPSRINLCKILWFILNNDIVYLQNRISCISNVAFCKDIDDINIETINVEEYNILNDQIYEIQKIIS